jgi:hypothetical protein
MYSPFLYREISGTGGITLDTPKGCCVICYYWCHINQAIRRQHGGWNWLEYVIFVIFNFTFSLITINLHPEKLPQYDKITSIVKDCYNMIQQNKTRP